ncbi:hypothetical protein [Hellea balneolensis]|uniref:hypothetical protein n=1 Tax=Hellea balneolensis TaxID=287478 RepID=UPI00040026FF|nr:hypothetical protein [Hellea balneolensis]
MADIYKDFLPKAHFTEIQKLFMTNVIPWFFTDRVVSTEQHFMFAHTFMDDGKVINQRYFEPVRGIIHQLLLKEDFMGVSRIRAVLYTNQGKKIHHPIHVDIPLDSGVSDKFRTAVFHINTCNGETVIGGTVVPSLANQMIIFDNEPHYGTVQTDTDTRVVLNFNLRKS